MRSRRWARRALAPISAALLLVLSSCAGPPPVPAKYGLRIGTEHQAVVARAVEIANTILGPRAAVRLRTIEAEAEAGATVYLVRGPQLGRTEYCFVPEGESCVFVNDARFDDALRLFAGHAGSDFSVPPEHLLALMLLHEAGHLAYHDAGSYTPPAKLGIEGVTATMSVSKSREIRADAYAIRAIVEAFSPGQPMPRFLVGGALVQAVTKISWNLGTRRMLDDFAANALRDQRLFVDQGYTHPNFELRFLIMNDQLNSTETSRALLADFIAGREPSGAPKSLLGIPSLTNESFPNP
jgi:hypothetical protein